MGRLRATLARSESDRELHQHIDRAGKALRAAMAVCSRAARFTPEPEVYQSKLQKVARAERLLADIGHLKEAGDQSGPDLQMEARALCAWLESRERGAGVVRPSRRGQEYQDRLRRVLGFLEGRDPAAPEEKPEEESPPEEKPEDTNMGALWNRAVKLAQMQGEGDNDAYITAIFKRLASGESDG